MKVENSFRLVAAFCSPSFPRQLFSTERKPNDFFVLSLSEPREHILPERTLGSVTFFSNPFNFFQFSAKVETSAFESNKYYL
jgi:hypothetical protein